MAREVTIRLMVDPQTRKKNVVISYHGDGDELPIEHEDTHRRLVDKLIEGGTIKAADLGKIIIDREGDHRVPEVGTESAKEREATSQKG